MLRLTHKEQILAAALMLAFLVGMGVKHYREKRTLRQFTEQITKK